MTVLTNQPTNVSDLLSQLGNGDCDYGYAIEKWRNSDGSKITEAQIDAAYAEFEFGDGSLPDWAPEGCDAELLIAVESAMSAPVAANMLAVSKLSGLKMPQVKRILERFADENKGAAEAAKAIASAKINDSLADDWHQCREGYYLVHGFVGRDNELVKGSLRVAFFKQEAENGAIKLAEQRENPGVYAFRKFAPSYRVDDVRRNVSILPGNIPNELIARAIENPGKPVFVDEFVKLDRPLYDDQGNVNPA